MHAEYRFALPVQTPDTAAAPADAILLNTEVDPAFANYAWQAS